jgi:hypothetical protein
MSLQDFERAIRAAETPTWLLDWHLDAARLRQTIFRKLHEMRAGASPAVVALMQEIETEATERYMQECRLTLSLAFTAEQLGRLHRFYESNPDLMEAREAYSDARGHMPGIDRIMAQVAQERGYTVYGWRP